MENVQIGVIGGSGFYEIEGMSDIEEIRITTPFGDPSDTVVVGTLEGRRVAFLPRHGRGHVVLPSGINFRANVFAMKTLGVEYLISVSAIGSLREEMAPRHFVIPNQIFDHTKRRVGTFFDEGIVVHVGMADPFCGGLGTLVADAAEQSGATVHRGAMYICMEGPQFSTKGESELYRRWGMDIIGMTAMPEAKLAREAEMCYAVLGAVTDYDCWHPEHDSVTVQMLLDNLRSNSEAAKRTLKALLPMIPAERTCSCKDALATAVVSQPDAVSKEVREKLKPLIGRYFS